MRQDLANQLALQLTHPCGVRQVQGLCAAQARCCNSRTPCGVRQDTTKWSAGRTCCNCCNSRTPAECDADDERFAISFIGCNSRTPTECDKERARTQVPTSRFQFTHPCGMRPGAERSNEKPVAIHAPLWSATCGDPSERTLQFTHPCGVRPDVAAGGVCATRLQFTHPCGVRLAVDKPWVLGIVLQFTHSCGVRRAASRAAPRRRGCNSRTLAGCDHLAIASTKEHLAIHAPLRDATQRSCCPSWNCPMLQFTHPLRSATKSSQRRRFLALVAIHAPLRSATLGFEVARAVVFCCNSRTPAECDSSPVRQTRHSSCCNSRTPAECDEHEVDLLALTHRCNSRTPAECDQGAATLPSIVRLQFTHPCGVRRRNARLLVCLGGFNSRTPAECDLCRAAEQQRRGVSIHALLRSATSLSKESWGSGNVSIHALLRSATVPYLTYCAYRAYLPVSANPPVSGPVFAPALTRQIQVPFFTLFYVSANPVLMAPATPGSR